MLRVSDFGGTTVDYLIMLLSAQQARRIRVIENILVNKRTVATLFWGMRYQILPWLGYRRKVSRRQFDIAWQNLLDAGLITIVEQQAQLTARGEAQQRQFYSTHYQPRYQAAYLLMNVDQVIQRLLLATQVVSEYSYESRQYAPFSFNDDDLRAVKQWFTHQNKAQLVLTYKQELADFLATLTDEEADFMVSQFIGHEVAGEALTQLADRLAIDVETARLMQYDLFAGLAQYGLHLKSGALYQLIAPMSSLTPMSNSAAQTYTLFQQRLSIQQISRTRRLKIGTVREHLLEAAIFEGANFPYDWVLSSSQQTQLATRYGDEQIDHWQFQEQETDTADAFFYFRLYQIMRSFISSDDHTGTD